ncbi:hypothetical protein C1637_05995 [Chryseobacterium lactis]|uniref:Uncharacterized protein n=1 Tax=Chryseobacterium lactis TaxID=1241981 RepID=A0A3G6RTG5_CHRLC|nr:hypothetical protein [Chryseobacterium lactis]AZA84392.1 hypothetical protein EG342_21965 [Chryseobacterium lactis]AZB04780.1 hypothetical protein EG341_12845 [Chryseobacterium lactis]PNW14511.1 hypothetical protein C1637_05995 [Chryseobacterium lactis]
MELDTLKNSWKTISIDTNQNEFDIISATKKEMISPLMELKRKSKNQVKILPILFAFLVVVASKISNVSDNLLIWMALIILPILTVYYYFNLKLIHDLETFNGSVKNDIETKIKRLIKTNITYLIITRVFFLAVIIFCELFLRNNKYDLVEGLHALAKLSFPFRLGIYGAIFGMHYLISQYTFKQYFGKYLEQLKKVLSDMQ